MSKHKQQVFAEQHGVTFFKITLKI